MYSVSQYNCYFENATFRDSPGGPVVKSLPWNAGERGSIPDQGSKIKHALERLSHSHRSLYAAAKTRGSQMKKIKIKKIKVQLLKCFCIFKCNLYSI